MSLTKPSAPSGVRQAFEDRIATLPSSAGLSSVLSGSQGGQPPEPLEQHVFTVGLQDLAEGAGLSAARSTGWRLLSTAPSGSVAAGEVSVPTGGGAPRMAGITEGPAVAEIVTAEDKLNDLPEVQGGDYELHSLDIPSLLIEAFWLKSRSEAGDLVVPIRALIPQLQAMRAYPVADFLEIVKPLAIQRLQFDDSPRP
jgi:hypothetical protein